MKSRRHQRSKRSDFELPFPLTTPCDEPTGTNLGNGGGLHDPFGERGDVTVAMPPSAGQDSRPVAQERSITKEESGAAMRERVEAQQFVWTVGDLLSELEGLSPRQLSRFMRSNGEVGMFLDCLSQLADEEGD